MQNLYELLRESNVPRILEKFCAEVWRAHDLTKRSNLPWIPERFCIGGTGGTARATDLGEQSATDWHSTFAYHAVSTFIPAVEKGFIQIPG